MNKIFKTMMLAAATVLGIASCENVPAPFIEPGQSGTEESTDAKGSGTLADPFNVPGVINYVKELGADVESPEQVYIKGVVCSTKEISPQYGNATFNISVDVNSVKDAFTIYRAKGLNNQNIKSEDDVQVGDTVIVYGNVVNYRCNTPETVQGKAYIYWQKRGDKVLDGSGTDTPDTPTEGAKGDGSLENPFNAAGAHNYVTALPADEVTAEKFYIKGIVCESSKMDISTQYKNATFHISEDGTANGTQFLIFRTKGLNGADITSADDVKVGDEVVIYAQLVNYKGNTPETSQGGMIYSQKRNGQDMGNGEDDDTPSDAQGDGTIENPWNVAGVLKAFNDKTYEEDSEYYVKGIITKVSSFNSKYSSISYYISDDASGSNKFYIYSGLGLDKGKFSGQNDLHVGDEVVVCGKLTLYNNEPQFNYNNYLVSHKSNSNPEEETESSASFFKASDLGLENGKAFTSVSVYGVTLSVTDGGNNNGPKYYDNGSNLRMYPQNTLTISTEKVISSIKLNCTSEYVASGDASSNKGTIKVEDPTITISDINDKSFTLTNTSTTTGAASQIRIESFEITYAE